MGDPIRVVILHRHRLVRDGLAWVLSRQPRITVVGCVAEMPDIVRERATLCPDVVLMALTLPGRAGLSVMRQFHTMWPDAKIILMDDGNMDCDVLACVEAGAAAYMAQDASLEELLTNIGAVTRGEVLCSPKVVGNLFSQISDAAHEEAPLHTPSLMHLTHREREVLALLGKGWRNKEIALHLRIELPTVKNHVHNLLHKLSLTNRREAAQYVRDLGVLGEWS